MIEPKLHKTLQRVLVFSFGIFILPHLKPFSNSTHRGYSLSATERLQERPSTLASSLINPGKGVGFLKLGDTRERVLELFPLNKEHDNEYTYSSCGPRTEIHWLDLTRGVSNPSEMSFFLRDNRVFQIESADPRFRTKDGITTNASPRNIRRQYPGLTAYALVRSGGKEVGGRDLVYWISKQQGIAFEFAYHSSLRRRLTSKVIVFPLNSEFHPGGCIVPPREWVELAPYSLEPPVLER